MECYHAMISVPTVLAEMNHLMTTQGHHPCVIDEVRAEIMPVILAGCGGSLLQSLSLSLINKKHRSLNSFPIAVARTFR